MIYRSHTYRWNEGNVFYRVKTFCYNESDRNDNVYLHALIGVFSEIVSDRERFAGEGFEFFAKHGQATLATRTSLGINRLPRANETVIFKAWVSSYKDMRMYNEVQALSVDGELLVSCLLTSRTIDTKTLEVIRPESFAGTLPVTDERRSGAPECSKVVAKGEPEPLGSYAVRYCDIDTHGNMNNSRYTELVTNLLPEDTVCRIPREYVINHTRRVLPGDTIELFREREENAYRTFGFVEGNQCFASEHRF